MCAERCILFLCQLVHVRVGDIGLCGNNTYYDNYPSIKIKYQAYESTVSGLYEKWSVWLFATSWTIQSMNFPGQNTGVGGLSLFQGIFPTQGSNPGLHIVDRFFTSWATREAQEYWSGWPIPSPGDLPDPGIEQGSPVLQADSLPTELSGKPIILTYFLST